MLTTFAHSRLNVTLFSVFALGGSYFLLKSRQLQQVKRKEGDFSVTTARSGMYLGGELPCRAHNCARWWYMINIFISSSAKGWTLLQPSYTAWKECSSRADSFPQLFRIRISSTRNPPNATRIRPLSDHKGALVLHPPLNIHTIPLHLGRTPREPVFSKQKPNRDQLKLFHAVIPRNDLPGSPSSQLHLYINVAFSYSRG